MSSNSINKSVEIAIANFKKNYQTVVNLCLTTGKLNSHVPTDCGIVKLLKLLLNESSLTEENSFEVQ